jgi:dTDP-4-dehydrorhamnose 3,5-epimerase
VQKLAKFNWVTTEIPDLLLIEPTVFQDERGFFMESYHKLEFAELGLKMDFVQDNHSQSQKGVLRGLHFQTEHAQGKLIRVIRGRVWDVAVDVRRGSPTLGRWFGVVLSEQNKKMMYVPAGFAHGFLTLEDATEFIYKCTDYYYPRYDGGIRFDDPDIGIQWPFKEYGLRKEELLLSEKDAKLPGLKELGIKVNGMG